ncbi:MAG: hypothetical protein RXS25_30070, partial [Paraburkholderia sp.]
MIFVPNGGKGGKGGKGGEGSEGSERRVAGWYVRLARAACVGGHPDARLRSRIASWVEHRGPTGFQIVKVSAA